MDFGFTDDLASYWKAASDIGSGATFTVPKTSETVPTNAIQSMAPVTGDAGDSGWGSFFQTQLSGIGGYLLQKDAIKTAGQTQQGNLAAQAAANAAVPRANLTGVAMLGVAALLAGVLIYKLVK